MGGGMDVGVVWGGRGAGGGVEKKEGRGTTELGKKGTEKEALEETRNKIWQKQRYRHCCLDVSVLLYSSLCCL